MASDQQSESASEPAFNSFNNDGSFLEQFRRMQEQQKQEKSVQGSTASSQAKPSMTTRSFMPATLSSSRISKSGTVIMKLGGVKKKTAPAVKLKRPPAALRGDSSSEDEGPDTESKPRFTSSSPAIAPSPATISASVATTATALAPAMLSVGSSFGVQAAAPPGSSLCASGPSGYTSVGGSSNVGGTFTVGGTSISNVGGATTSSSSQGSGQLAGKKRKRVSRWSDTPPSSEVTASSSKMSKESADDVAIAQAMASFQAPPAQSEQKGLTEAQLQQIREQIEMNRKMAEIKRAMQEAERKKNNKFEYDSDEDTEGGTWEHKARVKEMEKTKEKATELTEMNRGKHHISDFLPPEELAKFMETVSAIKEDRTPDFSDYKEHKLTEENVGFKLLQKAGWTEGSGLGVQEDGITAPINKGKQSFDQSGVGAVVPAEVEKEDDEFQLYRKRMMLAYRFRPNPLNNPRRPYY